MKISKKISELLDYVHNKWNKKFQIFYLSEDFSNNAHQHFKKLSNLINSELIKEAVGVYITFGYMVIFDYDNENDESKMQIINIKTGSIVTTTNVVELPKQITLFILSIVLFKKYAEVETKILPPKSKQGSTIKCKYINQTNHSITYLDSKWFTNLVKSDAFKVSGHFRLQPCKDENGLPTKKLIWINDFIKSGYTSPAKKLKYEHI